MLQDYLQAYVSKAGFPAYTELRAQQNRSRAVGILNGSLYSNASSVSRGVSARVVKGGSYGFASATGYADDPDSIDRIVKAALQNASFLDNHVQRGMPDFAAVAPFTRQDGLEHDINVEQSYLLGIADELDSYIVERYPKLLSRRVVTRILDMEKLLYTSDGVVSHSYVPRSTAIVVMTAEDKDGQPVELYKVYGGYGNFIENFPNASDFFSKIEAQAELLMKKTEGVYAKPGIQTVILDSDLAGILAHEAVGHTVEADFVQSGSVGGPNFGKQVASEMVSLVDIAHDAFGKLAPVPVFVDDEGSPAKDQMLIENGILVGYMHNKESAREFGHEPNGNARAYDFSDEPLIRMRNTCILPGKDKLEEMIASVEDGYYLTDMNNGQADSTGEFMFGVPLGFEIKNGKLGRAIRDCTVSGVAFDVLKTVDMVSDKVTWTNSGMCGKKQMIPVGMGGPAIKVKINVGGRA
ncbi:MAG: TldD/PmbA family protein [Anaerolineaceae bacterium]|nr:TldD/PmbA family protein [Anaerolineaceae bacterium]